MPPAEKKKLTVPGNKENIFQAIVRDLHLAAVFLMRIPLPELSPDGVRPLSQAAWSFPVIGLGVGAAGGVALMAGFNLGLHPLLCALMALAVQTFMTGALHEDGLADVADGFGGGQTSRDKLHIMRDSRIGSYGVLALVFSVALRGAALSGMAGAGIAALALIVSGALSRSTVVMVMAFMSPARADGLGSSAGKAALKAVVIAFVISIIVAHFIFEALVWPVLAVALIAATLVAWMARRQVGGFTGDVLGTVQQVSEIAILVALASVLD